MAKIIFDQASKKRQTVPGALRDEIEETLMASEKMMDNRKVARELVKIAKSLTAEIFDEFPVVGLWLVSSDVIDYMTTVSRGNESYSGARLVVEKSVGTRGMQIRKKLARELSKMGISIFGMSIITEAIKDDSYNIKIRFSIGTNVDLREVKQIALSASR